MIFLGISYLTFFFSERAEIEQDIKVSEIRFVNH